MFEGMERGELRTLYVMGENPAQSEADINRTRRLLSGLDFMVVQDILFTKTCEYADVVLPSSASWAEAEGTVTSSERRVQRVRKALDPPGEARDDTWILARAGAPAGLRLGRPDGRGDLGRVPLAVADARGHELRAPGGDGRHPVAVPRRGAPGLAVPARPPVGGARGGPRAPFSVVEHAPPVDALDADYPLRLTTGRRLESFNTGVQSNRYRSPLHKGEALCLSPEDADGAAGGGGRDRARVEPPRLGRGAGAGRRRRCGPGSRS